MTDNAVRRRIATKKMNCRWCVRCWRDLPDVRIIALPKTIMIPFTIPMRAATPTLTTGAYISLHGRHNPRVHKFFFSIEHSWASPHANSVSTTDETGGVSMQCCWVTEVLVTGASSFHRDETIVFSTFINTVSCYHNCLCDTLFIYHELHRHWSHDNK